MPGNLREHEELVEHVVDPVVVLLPGVAGISLADGAAAPARGPICEVGWFSVRLQAPGAGVVLPEVQGYVPALLHIPAMIAVGPGVGAFTTGDCVDAYEPETVVVPARSFAW